VLPRGGAALVSIHIGNEVRQVDEWHGEAVDLDFRFLLNLLWRRSIQLLDVIIDLVDRSSALVPLFTFATAAATTGSAVRGGGPASRR
jgi:hypothetical protein